MGRFSYQGGYGKGYDILMRAFKGLPPEYTLCIIGDEPTEEFKELKNQLDIDNLIFTGFKTPTELRKYYVAADLFCLQTRGDIWGLVINEAMSYGLPVVTTDRCIAGLEFVQNGKNGYIVDVENVDGLHERIKDVLQDEDVRGSMAMNSLETIRDYTYKNMAGKHLETLYKHMR